MPVSSLRIAHGRGRTYLYLTAVGLVVAALTLIPYQGLTYDPFCWVTWGREILHGQLLLYGGPSWKPLPVIFTTVFAIFGSAAPSLWIVVARAGLVVSTLMIARLAMRVTVEVTSEFVGDSETRAERIAAVAPAVVAALIAAVGYLLGKQITRFALLANSEGVLTAAALIAVERAYDGHHRQAFALGAITGLDRPESWALWMPYGLWLMWRDPKARVLVPSLALTVVLLWLIPERLGSTSFTSSINRATEVRTYIQEQSCPICSDLRSYVWPLLPGRLRVVAMLPVFIAPGLLIWSRIRKRPWKEFTRFQRALLAWGVIATMGMGWWIVIAIESQFGFSGSIRYLMLGTAFMYISGGVGYGFAAGLVTYLIRRWRPLRPAIRAALPVATAAVAAAVFAFVPAWIESVSTHLGGVDQKMRYDNVLMADAQHLIQKAGGAKRIRDCGQIISEFFAVPMLSWYLSVPLGRIYIDPGSAKMRNLPPPVGVGSWPQVIFQDRSLPDKPLRPWNPAIQRWQHLAGRKYEVYKGKELTLYVNCNR